MFLILDPKQVMVEHRTALLPGLSSSVDFPKQMAQVLGHSVLGLSMEHLVPTMYPLTAPLRVCPAMKNSNEYDSLGEHSAGTLSTGNTP